MSVERIKKQVQESIENSRRNTKRRRGQERDLRKRIEYANDWLTNNWKRLSEDKRVEALNRYESLVDRYENLFGKKPY